MWLARIGEVGAIMREAACEPSVLQEEGLSRTRGMSDVSHSSKTDFICWPLLHIEEDRGGLEG